MRRAGALLVFLLTAVPAAAQAPARILVVPFENPRNEPRLYWMSEASAILVAEGLNGLGLRAITREERVRAFEQLHLPWSASLSRATVIKVGELVGASEVIVGGIVLEGANLAVTAHSIRIDIGRLQPEVRERGRLEDLFAVFDRLAVRLAPGVRASAANARPSHPSLEAFENYVKGLIAEGPSARATFLETALGLQPGYDRAQVALWDVRADQGDHTAALAAARAVSAASPLARTGRFLAAISLLELERYDEAYEAFTGLLSGTAAGSPGSGASVNNNLGVLQIRRGSTPQTGTATYFLTKAAEADPADTDFLFNLGYAYVLERNSQAAIYWLREAVRRDPADADAHFVLASALQSTGSTVEASRERELARQLSAEYETPDGRPAADRSAVPKGLERVRTDLNGARALRPEQAMVQSAQRETRELAGFHLERGRRLFEREEDREALVELKRAIYIIIGRIHLRAGRPEEAVDALKISVWSADTAAGRVALAQAYLKLRKTDAAKSELTRALALDPASADAKRLLAEIK
jgi:predicted Zn-dependent protease/TolB-like protein